MSEPAFSPDSGNPDFSYAEAGRDFWQQEIAWLEMLFGKGCVKHEVETLSPGQYRHTIQVVHCPAWEVEEREGRRL